jgi:ANTAR domain
LEGRRVLDLAEGILIGLRRFTAEEAFDELVAVAQHHDMSMSAVASALVDLATGTDAPDARGEERVIAEREWGALLNRTRDNGD